MVRAARRPLLLVLTALLVVSGMAAAEPERGQETPETARPGDHPVFAQLPPVPDATRLWAQMSSGGDAFFTLRKDVLPLPYTPATGTRGGPALTFEAFRHVTLSADMREVQYASRPAASAWNATLLPGRPIIAEWLLSTGERGTDIGATVPPLLVTTTVKAIDGDGFDSVLAQRTIRATPGGAPTPVRMTIEHLERPIPTGSRLVVELDWSWMQLPGLGTARQPFVTVHPGSFIDLPIHQPVRIESLDERTVDGEVYVQAKVAHLFAVENLALQSANLIVTGPNLQAQGGRAYVQAPRDGPGDGHVATFDWRLPISVDHLSAGTYQIHVAAGQATEPGPRVIATTSIEVDERDEAPALDEPVMPSALLVAAAGLVLVVASLRRR